MSSLSSPVKTASQQFRSVCLSEILGISHDMYIHAIFLGIPFLLLLAHSVLLRPVHCFGLHFNCFVLLPVA